MKLFTSNDMQTTRHWARWRLMRELFVSVRNQLLVEAGCEFVNICLETV